jgi:putative phage-type endonuclease
MNTKLPRISPLASLRFLPGLSPDASTCGVLAGDTSMDTSRRYLRITFRQGTDVWHQWRACGIGASDAPIIMGECASRTRAQLMAEKLGLAAPREPNWKMTLGVELEPHARLIYNHAVGHALVPVCLQGVAHPWLRASLDGLSADGLRAIEIKCGRATYWRTRRMGRPPRHYHGQLQHILALTGLPRIDFVCYFPPDPPICLTVLRDEAYIQKLLEKEEAFWREVMQRRPELPQAA